MTQGVPREAGFELQPLTPAGPQGRRGSPVVLVLAATLLGTLLIAVALLAGADPGLAVIGAAYPVAADLAGRVARMARRVDWTAA